MDTQKLEITLIWHFGLALNISNSQDYEWANRWDLMAKIEKKSEQHYIVLKKFLDALETGQIIQGNKAFLLVDPLAYTDEQKKVHEVYKIALERLVMFCKSNRMEDALEVFQ
ncbi:MAG: hypothetical protein JWP12_1621 [Bacteroidetes bacterium]|nr:hypothetical protein [Bacteroidota bacterium]